MKTIWKWIIGIFLTILLVAGLAFGGYYARSYMLANRANLTTGQSSNTAPGTNQNPAQPGQPGWQHPNVQGWEGRSNGKFSERMGGNRMFGRGSFREGRMYMPFGIGFMIIGGILRLIPLVLFGLLLYGIYLLGRRSGQRSAMSAASVTKPTPVSAVEENDGSNTPAV